MTSNKHLHEQNRLSWNAATRAHNSHKVDQAAFLRDGGTTLFAEDFDLLGDVSGQRVLHLQCNAGQDTLSLAHLGAQVTGVDISDEAIDFARALSRDSGIAAAFERADVYDWLEQTAADATRRFDVVYASYGALPWLSDLPLWARGVASVLAPGGRVVVLEFHPVAALFDDDLTLHYAYTGDIVTDDSGVRDYVAASGSALAPSGYQDGDAAFANPHASHDFCWGVGDLVGALLGAGLPIRRFEEYMHSNGCRLFSCMEVDDDRRYRLPDSVPALPLMLGVTAGR